MVVVVSCGTYSATYLWLRIVAGATVINSIVGSTLMALAVITAGRVWGLI